MGLQKFQKNILKATSNLEFSAVSVFPDSSITLDTRMSNLDIRVSVPTILVLLKAQVRTDCSRLKVPSKIVEISDTDYCKSVTIMSDVFVIPGKLGGRKLIPADCPTNTVCHHSHQ